MKSYGVTNHTNPLQKYFQMVPLVFDNFQIVVFIFWRIVSGYTWKEKSLYLALFFQKSERSLMDNTAVFILY